MFIDVLFDIFLQGIFFQTIFMSHKAHNAVEKVDQKSPKVK